MLSQIAYLLSAKHSLVIEENLLPEPAILEITAIIVLGIGAQWLAWRIQLPSILLLLLFGFLAGPVTGYLDPNHLLGDLLLPIASISVAVILFEGGLSLNVLDLSQIRNVLVKLISLGVLVTWIIGSAAAYFLVGLQLKLSLLLGAILVVSGPTVVLPLLRHVRPLGDVSSILRWEGIVVDPVGAMLAVIVFEAVTAQSFGSSKFLVISTVLKTVAIGSLLGIAGAGIVTFLLRRHWIPDYLQNPVTLMLVVTTFTVSNILENESGLFTVTVMGVALANQKIVSVRHIIEFKENLRTLLLSSLFILLAARLDFHQLVDIGPPELFFLATLILVGRPAAVAVSTLGSHLNWRERVFLAWMAPRGIVAAAVTSVFALQMREAGFDQAERLVPLAFLVIVGTVVIYGLTAAPLSRWLQVAGSKNRGFLILGAHAWARDIAAALQEEGTPVRLIDTNRGNVAQARLAGLQAFYGNVLAADIVEELDLEDVGHLMALTSNDEVNSLATLHFTEMFGRSEVYQLAVERNGDGEKESLSHHLLGRQLFGREFTYRNLAGRFAAGATIKKTSLTEEFSFEDYRARYGDDAVALFVISAEGLINVVTDVSQAAPTAGETVISLAKPIEEC